MKLYSHVSDVHSLEVLNFRLRQKEKKHWNESILRQSTETDKDVGTVALISDLSCIVYTVEKSDRYHTVD